MEGVLFIAALIVVAVLVLVLKDRLSALFRQMRNPPEKVAADRRRFTARLESPDWLFYEEHLGRPVPAVLRETFSKKEHLGKTHYFGDYYVAFAPVDSAALAENWVVQGIVPFADSDGDPIFLKPGASEEDAVY
ncbi:MAG TPA: hypothetical protein VGD41_18495, partial [Pyrinomonadaceae bacterium]